MASKVATGAVAATTVTAVKKTGLVLFKWTDLRLHDHPALYAAHQKSSSVLHLFVLDPFWFGRTSFGLPKTGYFRAKFLLESLRDLRKSLKSHGSTLIVRTGFTPSVVKQVVASVGADSIYMSQEVMSEELAIEKAMLEELGKLPQKVAVQRFWANTLYDKADLPFDASSHRSMPQIYTQFRKAVESKGRVQEPLPVPLAMKPSPIPTDSCPDPAGPFPLVAAHGQGPIIRGANAGEGLIPSLEGLGFADPIAVHCNPRLDLEEGGYKLRYGPLAGGAAAAATAAAAGGAGVSAAGPAATVAAAGAGGSAAAASAAGEDEEEGLWGDAAAAAATASLLGTASSASSSSRLSASAFPGSVAASQGVYLKDEEIDTLPATLPFSLAPASSSSAHSPSAGKKAGGSLPPKGVLPFHGGESAALARMKDYFWTQDALRVYKETRNGMLGANYSSKFSPWLAFGCISPRQIHAEIKAYEAARVANDSTYWLIFELLWRDFFKFACIGWGDRVFHLWGPRGSVDPSKVWRQDSRLFKAWALGRTGYPFVDANMRELLQSGFMSNRGRQNVASFFTKDLQLDWRLGAEWFESLLIDHDPCSNSGNWGYVAGVGSDPRENRYFLIPKQSKDYDPEARYMRHWLPELAAAGATIAALHDPERLTPETREAAGGYPAPVVKLMVHRGEGGAGRTGGAGGGGAGGRAAAAGGGDRRGGDSKRNDKGGRGGGGGGAAGGAGGGSDRQRQRFSKGVPYFHHGEEEGEAGVGAASGPSKAPAAAAAGFPAAASAASTAAAPAADRSALIAAAAAAAAASAVSSSASASAGPAAAWPFPGAGGAGAPSLAAGNTTRRKKGGNKLQHHDF